MKARIFEIVGSALTELNEELQYDSLENITPETGVMSGEDSLDSLSFVGLLVTLESEILNQFGKKLGLAEQVSVSPEESPFRTVGSMVDFIDSLLVKAA